MADCIKQDTSICYYKRFTSEPKIHTDKVRGGKKVFHSKGNHKKAGVAILILDKADFETKFITKDKEEHYIMIKGSIQGEDIMSCKIYAPNMGALKYIEQVLTDIMGETDNNTIIIGYFNTPLTSMDRSSRQKIKKETVALTDTIDQID